MSKLLARCGIEKDFVGPSDISLVLFITTIFFNLFSNVYLSLYASPEFSIY